MDPRSGPRGDSREVFQTNFAFARHVRQRAQGVHVGYWQCQHPHEEGFRPDQVMRYSEANLNRVQIAGELHVKSGKDARPRGRADFDSPLDVSMLHSEASFEQRSQSSKSSAADMVESVLLDAHHAMWLAANPRVAVRDSLEQDRILGDAERQVKRRAPKLLDRLRAEARRENLEISKGRVRSDWIEPEPLFWAAWSVLDAGERPRSRARPSPASSSACCRPRPRIRAATSTTRWSRTATACTRSCGTRLTEQPSVLDGHPAVRREAARFQDDARRHLERRLAWSPAGDEPPWRTPYGSLGPFSSR
jgi:hypothetical protein